MIPARRFGGILAATVLSLTIGLPALSQAQPAQGGARRQGQRGARIQLVQVPVEALDSVLKLTADQKSKITSIRDKYEADARPFRPTRGTPPDPANAQKLRELTTQATRDIQAVLTPEQTEKLRTIAPVWSALRSSGIPLVLLAELKLTDDQKEKITAVVTDMAAKLRTMTPDERRAQSRQMRQDARAKVEALLTQEQKDKIQKYMQEHPRGRGRRGQGA